MSVMRASKTIEAKPQRFTWQEKCKRTTTNVCLRSNKSSWDRNRKDDDAPVMRFYRMLQDPMDRMRLRAVFSYYLSLKPVTETNNRHHVTNILTPNILFSFFLLFFFAFNSIILIISVRTLSSSLPQCYSNSR